MFINDLFFSSTARRSLQEHLDTGEYGTPNATKLLHSSIDVFFSTAAVFPIDFHEIDSVTEFVIEFLTLIYISRHMNIM